MRLKKTFQPKFDSPITNPCPSSKDRQSNIWLMQRKNEIFMPKICHVGAEFEKFALSDGKM